MSPSNTDTQDVRTVQSRPSCLKRIVQLLVLAIATVGIFAFGYGAGSGVEILAPANALIETAIASLPDAIQTPFARSPLSPFTTTPTDTQASISTDTPTGTSTDTPVPADTSTDTPVPTDTPTDTSVPTDTPTDTPVPTDTPTDTPVPTDTPTDTPVPTDTPTDTPVPTNTPTATEPPPTRTPLPTATRPLPTPTAPTCYHNEQVWVTGDMNVREQPSINARKVDPARAGESYSVLESRQGDTYCWLRVSKGWMARTAYVSATKPQVRVPSSAGGRRPRSVKHLECPCGRT